VGVYLKVVLHFRLSRHLACSSSLEQSQHEVKCKDSPCIAYKQQGHFLVYLKETNDLDLSLCNQIISSFLNSSQYQATICSSPFAPPAFLLAVTFAKLTS
jgi:hypothetical protein